MKLIRYRRAKRFRNFVGLLFRSEVVGVRQMEFCVSQGSTGAQTVFRQRRSSSSEDAAFPMTIRPGPALDQPSMIEYPSSDFCRIRSGSTTVPCDSGRNARGTGQRDCRSHRGPTRSCGGGRSSDKCTQQSDTDDTTGLPGAIQNAGCQPTALPFNRVQSREVHRRYGDACAQANDTEGDSNRDRATIKSHHGQYDSPKADIACPHIWGLNGSDLCRNFAPTLFPATRARVSGRNNSPAPTGDISRRV